MLVHSLSDDQGAIIDRVLMILFSDQRSFLILILITTIRVNHELLKLLIHTIYTQHLCIQWSIFVYNSTLLSVFYRFFYWMYLKCIFDMFLYFILFLSCVCGAALLRMRALFTQEDGGSNRERSSSECGEKVRF